MEKDKLLAIMLEQKESFCSKKDLIDRDIPLESYLKTTQVVVITGVRRCGKSSLLSIIKEKLKLKEQEFCYFNFDDERVIGHTEILNDLYQLHIETYRQEPVFFFDEIQFVSNWEKFVNRMHEAGKKIYVTGSNAKLLSSEISTSLTGRNKVIELFPFSFSEYLLFLDRNYNTDRLSPKQKSLLLNDLKTYLEMGGFPLIIKENDPEIINSWFQDILYRDIVARYNLSHVNEIRQMLLYLLSNTGKLFSYNTLKSVSGVKSLSSVKDYLYYFERSYLLFYLSKFDYSLKKQVMNSKKVYAIDNLVTNKLGLRFSDNLGRLLENMIFLELKRRGKETYYFSNRNECDFLIREGLAIKEAIQVVYELSFENHKREIAGLKEAMKIFNIPEGKIITFGENQFPVELENNVKIIPAWKWLLNKDN